MLASPQASPALSESLVGSVGNQTVAANGHHAPIALGPMVV